MQLCHSRANMRTAILHGCLESCEVYLTHIEMKSPGGDETIRRLLEHRNVGDLREQNIANFSAEFHASRGKFGAWLMASALGHAAAPSMQTGLVFVHRLPLTDIEQPLTGRNVIKPTDLFPKEAQDFALHLVEPFNQVVDLALHGHADAMDPFEQLEDPTQGRPHRRLVDLVRYGLILVCQGMAQSTLCRQGSLRISAAITQAEVIRTILRHLQLAADPPPMAPARARQATCDWVASAHAIARGLGGDVRATAVCLLRERHL